MRDVCQDRVSIHLGIVTVRWDCVCVGAGVVIVVTFGKLAFVLFCCWCSSDDV